MIGIAIQMQALKAFEKVIFIFSNKVRKMSTTMTTAKLWIKFEPSPACTKECQPISYLKANVT